MPPSPLSRFRSFITGSRAYGTPRPDSDLDLVLYVDGDAYEELTELAEPRKDDDDYAVRFGRLNLILCDDWADFLLWKQGTEELKKRAPVTREEAVKHFDALFERAGEAKSEDIRRVVEESGI